MAIRSPVVLPLAGLLFCLMERRYGLACLRLQPVVANSTGQARQTDSSRSLAKWLCRAASKILTFDANVWLW
jgi:hypothetical protein